DVGKINCYEYNETTHGDFQVTTILREQDHIIHGVKLISQYIKSEKLDDIIHIVASHHALRIWGSPVEPQSNEAWIVHLADNLSSRIMG
ncbi:MAG: HD domain-containing protein, partial [Methermicoccaceae archaeon]